MVPPDSGGQVISPVLAWKLHANPGTAWWWSVVMAVFMKWSTAFCKVACQRRTSCTQPAPPLDREMTGPEPGRFPEGVQHRWFREVGDWTVQRHDGGRITCIRDGVDHSRFFMNVAGLAYDAWLVKKIEEHPASRVMPDACGASCAGCSPIGPNRPAYKPVTGSGQVDSIPSMPGFAGTTKWRRDAGGPPCRSGSRPAGPDRGWQPPALADPPEHLEILQRSIGQVRDVETTFTREILVETGMINLYIEADGEWLGECAGSPSCQAHSGCGHRQMIR